MYTNSGHYEISSSSIQTTSPTTMHIGDVALYNGVPIGVITDISSLDKGNVSVLLYSKGTLIQETADEGELPIHNQEQIDPATLRDENNES